VTKRSSLFETRLKASAQQQLSALGKRDQRRIARKIDALAENPRPRHARKLEGIEELYRVRSGDYRIIYQVRDEQLLVLVVRIRHRRDAYRRL
jgi:mRNA interferase RelE/StbE